MILDGFNLVIEKLLIPTRQYNILHDTISMFQSRNRETFDSMPAGIG